jgi:hypothetical protein
MRLASLAGLALISHSLAILNIMIPNSLWERHRAALSLTGVWTACSVQADGELVVVNARYSRSSRPFAYPARAGSSHDCIQESMSSILIPKSSIGHMLVHEDPDMTF